MEQAANEAAWRQLLIQGVLTLLLPPEDLENPCLRTLVSEVLSELILGNAVGGKACEGWLIWDGITKAFENLGLGTDLATQAKAPNSPSSRLEQFGLLSAEQERISTIPPSQIGSSYSGHVQQIFWQIVRSMTVIFMVGRMLVLAFASSASLPERDTHMPPKRSIDQSPNEDVQISHMSNGLEPIQIYDKRPILEMSAWPTSLHLLCLDFRMPWLTGVISLLQFFLVRGPGMVGSTNGRLDK